MGNPPLRRLAPALLLAGCLEPAPDGAPAPRPAVGAVESAIRNGTREPQVVPLSEGQKLAIGWLHEPGWPQSNFCTGTIIAPRVVATAAHCTEGRGPGGLGFGVGLQPSEPRATFGVVAVHDHPRLDAAVLVLDRDATVAVPGLEPIAANRAPLDDDLVGREVEAAGYGETFDETRTGRYFAVVELIEVDPVFVRVDGRGRQGICFGDSGGPVMTVGPDGAPIVLGVEHGGDSSCLGVDALTRLDILADWIDGVVGDPPPAGPPADPGCGDVDYLGYCDGDVAVWCDGQSVVRRDCGDEGRVCGYVDDEIGWFCQEDACDGVTERGRCDGDVALRCEDGRLVEDDCGAAGARCVVDAAGATCARSTARPPDDPPPADPPPADDPPPIISPPAVEQPDPVAPSSAEDPGPPAAEPPASSAKAATVRHDGGCTQAPAGRAAGWAPLLLLALARIRRRART